MSYTISITRKGLVFQSVPGNGTMSDHPDALFVLDTEALAGMLDRKAGHHAPTRGETRGAVAAGTGMVSDGRSAKPGRAVMPRSESRVDWMQRLVDLTLVVSFFVFAAIYFA